MNQWQIKLIEASLASGKTVFITSMRGNVIAKQRNNRVVDVTFSPFEFCGEPRPSLLLFDEVSEITQQDTS